jgi:hypothetical protein
MNNRVGIETLADSFALALDSDQEWLRRVFIIGTVHDDHHDFVAQLVLRAQLKLTKDIAFFGSDSPFPVNKIVLIDDFDTILDLQLVQALASNGNVILCKFKAANIVSILHGISGQDTSVASNQRSLLSYIRFISTYRKVEDRPGEDVFYSTYIRFSQFIQDQLLATARYRWQERLKPHLSLEAKSPLGTMIVTQGMKFGNTALELAVANDVFWDA